MDALEKLLNCSGNWTGQNRVKPCPDDPTNESVSSVSITPILQKKFVQITQSWAWDGNAQEGMLLLGYSPKTTVASIHWIDTWHTGRSSMNLTGRFESDSKLVAACTFPVPNSPDWGWRIELLFEAHSLRINMFCINPENGKEEGWVWGDYVRSRS